MATKYVYILCHQAKQTIYLEPNPKKQKSHETRERYSCKYFTLFLFLEVPYTEKEKIFSWKDEENCQPWTLSLPLLAE